ncbi:MAG: deaminase [Myxococcales bacterium]|nr:deaminase [Myxococcales bacterium]
MIIGVAGRNAAGKGAVVSFLQGCGFVSHSLSDELREELSAQGVPESRSAMIELGRKVRRRDGTAGLAHRVLKRISTERNHVVDSIRHPAEVEALRENSEKFLLVWVDADEATRFERLQARGRSGDPKSLEEMRVLEGKELSNEDEAGQQLESVRAMSDYTIVNDASIESLDSKVSEVLTANLNFERPSWDEYFMSIASVVASRSNCVKRKVAAVITQDKRIISTGYNGTPRGFKNCNEGGCPRCNAFGPGGADLGDCLCSHGEENAIIQAAYHGVSVKGATLFTTFCPCLLCTKMIVNSGMAEVVFDAEYPLGERSLELLREAGVNVRKVERRC